MNAVRSPLALPPDDQLSAAQLEAAELIRSGPRGDLFGPFVPLLNSPVLMTRLQLVGAYLRYESGLPDELFELTVLTVARHWQQAFEWAYHRPLAIAAGVPESVVDGIAAEREPAEGEARFAAVWRAARALLQTGTLSTEQSHDLEHLGAPALVDLIATVGYYSTLAFVMNVDRTPAPGDQGPAAGSSR